MWPFNLFRKKIDRDEFNFKVKEEFEATQYTPDLPLLETVDPWLLFIYDDLQRDHPRHKKLLNAGARHVNIHRPDEAMYGYTSGDFVLWKHKDGEKSFFVALDEAPLSYQTRPEWDKTGPQPLKIKGQLYKIGWRGIAELDEHYRNTVEFQRRRVSIVVAYHMMMEEPDGSASLSLRNEEIIHAWMYVGVQKLWDGVLDGTFVPVRKLSRPNIPDHPHFYLATKFEYQD